MKRRAARWLAVAGLVLLLAGISGDPAQDRWRRHWHEDLRGTTASDPDLSRAAGELTSTRWYVRELAAARLERGGERAVAYLQESATSRDTRVAARACLAVGGLDVPMTRITPVLRSCLQSEATRVQIASVEAVGRLGARGGSLCADLDPLRRDASKTVREAAGLAYARACPTEAS